jgi:peroxiredoxin
LPEGDDLVVLGIYTADAHQIALDFLKQKGVTFRMLLDTSREAQNALSKYEMAGRSAVPMTYLIDAQGKVVDAWYGYQKGKTAQALRKLGLQDGRGKEAPGPRGSGPARSTRYRPE